jgi:hypothetical protein
MYVCGGNKIDKYDLCTAAAVSWFEKSAYCAGINILNRLPPKKYGVKVVLQKYLNTHPL